MARFTASNAVAAATVAAAVDTAAAAAATGIGDDDKNEMVGCLLLLPRAIALNWAEKAEFNNSLVAAGWACCWRTRDVAEFRKVVPGAKILKQGLALPRHRRRRH